MGGAEEPVRSPGGSASPDAVEALAAPLLPTREAATDLLVREEGAIRRVIGRYICDRSAVDDVWQELSLRVLRHLDTLKDPAALRGWIYQIARNTAMSWLRRHDRAIIRAGGDLPDAPARGELGRAPADGLLSAERVAAMRRALDDLPPSQREAIRLRIEEGLDHMQIAARLGINRQAVEVRLCKGRATLCARLAEILEGDL